MANSASRRRCMPGGAPDVPGPAQVPDPAEAAGAASAGSNGGPVGGRSARSGESPLALKRRARRINRALAEQYPYAHAELDFRNPFELLVATVLSAQTTD